MTKEITFDEVPAFALVKERIHANNPNVEFIKAGCDSDHDSYLLPIQLTKRTTLRLSKELLDDLNGKNNDHRKAELDKTIRDAIHRMK
ncbi:MAG: hypothetical protein ACLP7O_11015 [Terracidiphilus sp.]